MILDYIFIFPFGMGILGAILATGLAPVISIMILSNLSLVVMAIYTDIAQGIQPIISSNYGRGNKKNVQSILHYALISVLILSAAVYLGVFWGAEHIAGVFNSEQNPHKKHLDISLY